MCKSIEITIDPYGILRAFPGDCDDDGRACRDLSAPYRTLGRVVADVDRGTSHVVAIDVDIKDRAAFEAAAARCGMVAVDTGEWGWYGRWVNDYAADNAAYRHGVSVEDYGKCDFALEQADGPVGKAALAALADGRRLTPAEVEALRVEHHGADWRTNTGKPYSVGVTRNADGKYKLAYDFYAGGNGLMAKIGDEGRLLAQHYGVQTARNVATLQRHRIVSESKLPDGSIRLQVQVPARLKIG